MSEMIGRVSEALLASFKAAVAESAGQSFEEIKVAIPAPGIWERYARAAIKAMREPTEEMSDAVCSDVIGFDLDPKTYWHAMIDAALKS